HRPTPGAGPASRPRRRSPGSAGVATDHPDAELGVLLQLLRWTGVVGSHALRLRRDAEGEGDIEALERLHLAVEPGVRVRAKAVGPAQAGSQVPDPELLHPANGIIEPVILEMEPLTDAQLRCELGETPERELRCAVLPQQPHVEMAVI